AADPGALEAAPLGPREVGAVLVDPHGAVPQRGRDPLAAPGVVGPHPAGEPVVGVVAQLDGLGLGAERLHRDDRPEHLGLHDVHVPGAAGEHGGPVEVALGQFGVVRALAAGDDLRALLDAARHRGLDLGAVLGGDQRAAAHPLLLAAADDDRIGAPGQFGGERVVDVLVHDEPGTGRADLA